MPLPNAKYNKGKKGLGRALAGQDHFSSLIFYTASLPSGFSSSQRIKKFFQTSDAEAAGILNDYSDATPATATLTLTAAGNTGDKITIAVKDINSTGKLPVDANGNYTGPTLICSYIKLASDTTLAILGASISAAINIGTLTHGYSASFNSGTEVLTLTAPKKFGSFLNTGAPLVVTIVGNIAATIAQFTGGVPSDLAFYHYQIDRFFTRQPKGILFVGFFAIPGSYTFSEVNTVQNFSAGSIRQVAVYKDFSSDFSSSDLTALSLACVVSDNVHKPIQALYGADMTSISDIGTLTDLSLLTANKASAIIGMDGNAQGYFLFATSGRSVPAIGAALGTVALSKVSESIGWVDEFDMSDGIEYEEIAFANGQLFSSEAISDNLLDFLNDYRYIFLRKIVGRDGTFWNGGHTAISVSSDYAYIEDNRTIDKAIRGNYSDIIGTLNGPLELNDDGTLSDNTVAILESKRANLDSMVRAGELSDFDIVVDPNQLVLTTSKLVLTIELLQQGVARQIEVNIGFVPKIA